MGSCLQQDPELVRVSLLLPWLPGVLTERDFTHMFMIALRCRSPWSICCQPQQRGCGKGEWMEGRPPLPRQPCHAPRLLHCPEAAAWVGAPFQGCVCPHTGLPWMPCLEEGLKPVTPTLVSSALPDGGRCTSAHRCGMIHEHASVLYLHSGCANPV